MTQPLRILLIDDNRSDRVLIIRELQREFEHLDIQEIVSAREFDQAIASNAFDVVITDFQLRWTTGLGILETVKHHCPHCPVVMFTNTGTEEIAVEAMKLGLDDYIIKQPNRYIRVTASVRVALERRDARRRLALLEIRLEGLLNKIKLGVFRADATGSVLEANPAFLELLGLESLEQANQLKAIDTPTYYEQLTRLPPPQQQEQEVQLQRQDGTRFWALLTTTLTPINGITVMDGLLEDISDRKQTQESLQQLNTVLEARVQERTAQLEAANQDLEEFTYSVSHDLRAPLRAIQGFAQLLLQDVGDSLDPDNLGYLQRISANAQQIDTLITDLLTYSQLKFIEIELEPVDLSVVLTTVLAQLRPEIQAQQAQIQVDESLPIVQANRRILIQVLTNLLSNAIKFVAPGVQPQVRVWAEQRQDQMRLWIEDNGIGIAADRQQQIFNPFTRLHSEEEYPGTGIGLAIARKGIERIGGQIGVDSQLGQGSRFWIALL